MSGRLTRRSLAGWRDTVLFFTGIGLIINEALVRTGPERPSLLLLYAGMVGLPAVLRADERRTDRMPNDPEPEREHEPPI